MNIHSVFIIIIIVLCSSCAGSPPSGHVRASGFFQEKILIQSSEGLYVRLDNSIEPKLVADAIHKADADTFNFCDLDNNIGGLQAMNDLYVSIHLDQGNQAMVRQKSISYWERLYFEKKGETIVFKAMNNQFILPDKNNHKVLTANSESSQNPLCHFKIIPIP